MNASLVKYFQDYKMNLNITRMNYEATFDRFILIKQEVAENGPSKSLSRELQLLAKALFQNNYKLMETYLSVQNLYSNYSKEEKTVIDEYESLDKKVNRLITKMNSHQLLIKTKLKENSLLNV